jgi:hypothetical protein
MKNASLWALAGAAGVVGIAYACALPVDVQGCSPGNTSADCDVILAQASDFETPDASLPGQGGNAGSGSTNPPSGGSSGSNSAPSGGSAGSTSPPTGGSSGQGQAGSGSSAGMGGVSGSAGTGGGAGSGAAGAAGSGAAGAAGSGAAGTGGTTGQSNFDVEACDFLDRVGCEARACATACPTGVGNYCLDNCQAILACVAAEPTCITEADPMCGTAFTTPTYRENTCTPEVNSSGSPTTPNTPAFAALALLRCLCSDPRP